MWRNYLTVAFNALAKNRVYSVINLLGLAIGMAACLLILLFVRYETRYDRWLPGVEDTYQLQAWYPNPRDGEPMFLTMSSYASAAALRKDFPQVEAAVYMLSSAPTFMKDGEATTSEDYRYVDGDLLKVMDLPLLRGRRDALARPDTAIVTSGEAIRRFGTDDVVGRELTLISKGQPRDFTITGVIADLPKNSSLKINAVIRRDFQSFFAQEPDFLTCWGCQSGWVFVRLKPGTDPATIAAGMPAWEKRNIPNENNGEARFNAGDDEDWHLINLRDVHLGKAQVGAQRPGNDRRSIATFAIIALLILAMAVVNFINLSTARAGQRAREVALRKVLGATRRQLIAQFIAESVLIAGLAMLIALALVELAMPPFAAFLDADLAVRYWGWDGVLPAAIVLTIVVGALGGLYPAFFLSRFQPASVLKANQSASETPGSGRLRTALVIGQFAVSIGLIACTAIIYAQTLHARSADPGFRRDHILQVDNLLRYQLVDKNDLIVQRMRRLPGVTAVGRTDLGIGSPNNNNLGALVPGNPRAITIGQYRVDPGLFDAMGLTLVAGRWFDDRPADDSSAPFPADPVAERRIAARGLNIVVNEGGARKLGFTPQAAIGKTVRTVYFSPEVGLVPMTIVGVVKDSRFRSARDAVDTLMFVNMPNAAAQQMVIRFDGDPAAVRAAVGKAWREIAPDVPFEAKFSEEIVADLYRAEDARARLFAAFSLLAVIVGCLGLFGLASFTAERRTKEIGIRKVLGARTADIVRLLVWQFSRPVLIANLIAWPIAWWVMRDWLNGFDTRMTLGPAPFVLAGGLALAIAVATIVGHAVKVARANPIRALRYE